MGRTGHWGFRYALSVLVGVLVLPGLVSAMEYKHVTDEQLIREADRIVVARCLRSEVKFLDNAGWPFTSITFEMVEMVKGDLPTTFTLRLVGGQVGTTDYSGSEKLPAFSPNEEVILLLGPNNQDGYPLTSIYRWVYRITREPQSGRLLVADPPEIPLLESGTRDPLVAGTPIDEEHCPSEPDPAKDPECAALKMAGWPKTFANAKAYAFTEPVTVEDVIWSIRQLLSGQKE